MCKIGYELGDATNCNQASMYQAITISLNIPFSVALIKLTFPDMIEEFWFYEYHQTNYSYSKSIIMFIGGVNRDKYIPSFVKETFPTIYENYVSVQNHLEHHVFGDKSQYTDP